MDDVFPDVGLADEPPPPSPHEDEDDDYHSAVENVDGDDDDADHIEDDDDHDVEDGHALVDDVVENNDDVDDDSDHPIDHHDDHHHDDRDEESDKKRPRLTDLDRIEEEAVKVKTEDGSSIGIGVPQTLPLPDDSHPSPIQQPQPQPPQQQRTPSANSGGNGDAAGPHTAATVAFPQTPMPMMQQQQQPQGMAYSPMGFNPMMMMYGMMPAPQYNMPNHMNMSGYGGAMPTDAATNNGSNNNNNKRKKSKGGGEAKEGDYPPSNHHQQQQNMNHMSMMSSGGMMNQGMNPAAMMYNPYMMQQFQGMMNPFYARPGFSPMFNQNPPTNVRKGISLALSVDAEMLSEYQLLVRQQLELFEAGPEDVESNTQGRKKQVIVGQVGLRCRHCAPFPLRARGRGAVYYPAKLNGIYQAAQNMAGSHLCQSCQQIPPMIKAELQKLRNRRDNANGGKQYWADGCCALGVYETDQGLRLRRQASGDDAKRKSK